MKNNGLTTYQKDFIKKNHKRYTVNELARLLEVVDPLKVSNFMIYAGVEKKKTNRGAGKTKRGAGKKKYKKIDRSGYVSPASKIDRTGFDNYTNPQWHLIYGK